jgi:DNA-binding NarL/FixJ family response regulator
MPFALARANVAADPGWPEVAHFALVAALDQIAAPAFIARDDGAIRYANVRGHAMRRESAAFEEQLRAALPSGSRAFKVTRLDRAPRWFLVVGEPPPRAASPLERLALTPRQQEVLALLVDGATNRTIAELLGISERTVEVHLTTIYQRAGVENRASLVSLVLRAA